MRTRDDLRRLQALPLELKIKMTQRRIRDWVKEYGEDGVYVSFSGGKDSTVLLHIVREMYPDTEAVFVNTGLEYPKYRSLSSPLIMSRYCARKCALTRLSKGTAIR